MNTIRKNNISYRIRRVFTRLAGCAAVCAISFNCLYAAFEKTGDSARSQSMGSAFTGLADDLNAIKYNPAGLENLQGPEVLAGYGKLLIGLKDNADIVNSYFAAASPIRRWNLGTVGLSYAEINVSNFYKEDALGLTFSHHFSRASVGFTVKRYGRSVEPDIYTLVDPMFQKYGYSLSAYGYDLGFLYKLGKSLRFGFSVKDLNSPNVGFSSEDRIPAEYRFGLAYTQQTYNYTMDFSKKEEDISYNVGAERWFFDHYAMRGGLDFGSRDKRNLTTGFGFKYGTFQLDYSFALPLMGVQGTAGSHTVSITFKFGKKPIMLEAVKKIEERTAEGEPVSEDIKMLLDEITRLRQEVKTATGLKMKQEVKAAEERMLLINDFLKEFEKLKSSAAQPQKTVPQVGSSTAANAGTQPVMPAENTQSAETKQPARSRQQKELNAGTTGPQANWKIYIVRQGDTLQSIAKEYLGDPDSWVEIYKMNKDRVERGGVMKLGTILIIPPKK